MLENLTKYNLTKCCNGCFATLVPDNAPDVSFNKKGDWVKFSDVKELFELSDNSTQVEIALKACKLINEFHSDNFTGRPLEMNGKPINHSKLNEAHQLAEQALKIKNGQQQQLCVNQFSCSMDGLEQTEIKCQVGDCKKPATNFYCDDHKPWSPT